ncbi:MULTISPECIES: hypothetical protein [Bacteroides]|jgi:hypothetical protein|uniref:hypothetical protein n=1 Tax=Bacteroides TaxID=816 RepID=UPI0015F925D1|nr:MULTISPECIES: hypothetical protein [Bacteroides]
MIEPIVPSMEAYGRCGFPLYCAVGQRNPTERCRQNREGKPMTANIGGLGARLERNG